MLTQTSHRNCLGVAKERICLSLEICKVLRLEILIDFISRAVALRRLRGCNAFKHSRVVLEMYWFEKSKREESDIHANRP